MPSLFSMGFTSMFCLVIFKLRLLRSTPALATPPSVSCAFDPVAVVVDFVRSEDTALEMPPTLTVTQRQTIHELAKHYSLQHVSRGSEPSRFTTLAKPGVILGEVTLRRQLASEAILQGKDSEQIPESENVAAVLASAPVRAVDTYAVDGEPVPKRGRGRPVGSKKQTNTAANADHQPAIPVNPYKTRSKKL